MPNRDELWRSIGRLSIDELENLRDDITELINQKAEELEDDEDEEEKGDEESEDSEEGEEDEDDEDIQSPETTIDIEDV